MSIKFVTEEQKAIRFAVEMEGNVETYAMNFLKIYNNVREDRDLLKVYNNSGNTVYVVCKPEVADACKDWLEWFGTVSEPQEVIGIQPCLDDYRLTETDWDKLDRSEILDAAGDF